MNLTTETSSWLWAASVISFFAAIGGLVVLRGLWLEGYSHPESFKDIEEQRGHHKREGKGIKWVFWGVALEVLVAFGMTFKEGWEAHKTAIEIARNSPFNQEISDITINAVFNVKNSNVPYLGNELATWVSLSERGPRNSNSPVFMTLGDFGLLCSETIRQGTHQEIGNDYTIYSIQFRPLRQFTIPSGGFEITNRQPVTAHMVLDRIHALMFHIEFLPKNSEIVGGGAEMVINGTFRTTFNVYPQKSDEVACNHIPGDGACLWATNGVINH